MTFVIKIDSNNNCIGKPISFTQLKNSYPQFPSLSLDHLSLFMPSTGYNYVVCQLTKPPVIPPTEMLNEPTYVLENGVAVETWTTITLTDDQYKKKVQQLIYNCNNILVSLAWINKSIANNISVPQQWLDYNTEITSILNNLTTNNICPTQMPSSPVYFTYAGYNKITPIVKHIYDSYNFTDSLPLYYKICISNQQNLPVTWTTDLPNATLIVGKLEKISPNNGCYIVFQPSTGVYGGNINVQINGTTYTLPLTINLTQGSNNAVSN